MIKFNFLMVLAFMVMITIFSASCSKKTTKTNSKVNVYAAGNYQSSSNRRVAALWTNGERQSLGDDVSNSEAQSVTVADNGDTYVIGLIKDDNGNQTAVLWKNGQKQPFLTLPQDATSGETWSLYISGSNWYTSGYYKKRISEGATTRTIEVASVWKNGTLLYNLTDDTTNGEASSIYVSDTNTYVAGSMQNLSSPYSKAVIWKNGKVLYDLTDGTSGAVAIGIYLAGSDVYASGVIQNVAANKGTAVVWKNGKVLYNLTNGSAESAITRIYVVDGNVYAAVGTLDPNTQLPTTWSIWKNQEKLYDLDFTNLSVAIVLDLSIIGSDVYAGGYSQSALTATIKPIIWKNGKQQTQSIVDPSSTGVQIQGIFIK